LTKEKKRHLLKNMYSLRRASKNARKKSIIPSRERAGYEPGRLGDYRPKEHRKLMNDYEILFLRTIKEWLHYLFENSWTPIHRDFLSIELKNKTWMIAQNIYIEKMIKKYDFIEYMWEWYYKYKEFVIQKPLKNKQNKIWHLIAT